MPEKNKEGFLPKTQLIYFDIELAKAQYLKVPTFIEYFSTYRVFLQYNCTLFDKKRRQFFGRTFQTVHENVCKDVDHDQGPFLETTDSDRLFFHLHDNDVDDTILVVEVILNCEKTQPSKFSLGFFMIDLVRFDNKVFMIEETPRILTEERGDYYLKKRKIVSVPELIYSIDTIPTMMPINKIIGPNTLYCLREVMPFVDILSQKDELKDYDENDIYEWK